MIVACFFFLISLAACETLAKNQSVVIIGGGPIALSTAYWMSKTPEIYGSIKILDPYPNPSFASSWDVAAHAIEGDPLYSFISAEAMSLWTKDPVFSPHFFKTGYISGTYDSNSSDWVRD
jgi:hypothetical protein